MEDAAIIIVALFYGCVLLAGMVMAFRAHKMTMQAHAVHLMTTTALQCVEMHSNGRRSLCQTARVKL